MKENEKMTVKTGAGHGCLRTVAGLVCLASGLVALCCLHTWEAGAGDGACLAGIVSGALAIALGLRLAETSADDGSDVDLGGNRK